MNRREVFVSAVFVFAIFNFGFIVGYLHERQRRSGVVIAKQETSNYRSTKSNDGPTYQFSKEDVRCGRSATAAACDLAGRGVLLRLVSTGQAHTSGKADVCAALDLLWKAESGRGRAMSGDSGQARGHLQFHEGTWNDALELLGVKGDVAWQWPQATNEFWRCLVLEIAHWQRYCPQALKDGKLELLIRTHRLPSKPYRADNQAYVERVLKGAG